VRISWQIKRFASRVSGVAVKAYFSDWFDVDPDDLDAYGAFNVSLINDLPLFIDPFLLFTSENATYRQLHDEIIKYLKFLRTCLKRSCETWE
jgi:hypothetical protein